MARGGLEEGSWGVSGGCSVPAVILPYYQVFFKVLSCSTLDAESLADSFPALSLVSFRRRPDMGQGGLSLLVGEQG